MKYYPGLFLLVIVYFNLTVVQGVSIDFFNAQLPLHLESLCDHVISDHTGEDKMTVSALY